MLLFPESKYQDALTVNRFIIFCCIPGFILVRSFWPARECERRRGGKERGREGEKKREGEGRERERDRDRETQTDRQTDRQRQRDRQRDRDRQTDRKICQTK